MPWWLSLEANAGEVSAELACCGIAPATPVHVVVELRAQPPHDTAVMRASDAFAWLHDEPDLYTDADLLPR